MYQRNHNIFFSCILFLDVCFILKTFETGERERGSFIGKLVRVRSFATTQHSYIYYRVEQNNLHLRFLNLKSTNTYILKPKNDEMINSITIKFTENGELDYLDISTSLNQYTQIKFSNIKDNSNSIKASDFDFKAPKDTDVIDETVS